MYLTRTVGDLRLGIVATVPLLSFVVGCAGETEPESPPTLSPPDEIWFEERASDRGIDFVHRSGHRERYLMPEVVTGGAALCDLDGDDDLDLYFVQGGSLLDPAARAPGNALYENVGGGYFESRDPGAAADVPRYGMGVACGDYDEDGDADLYVTNYGANVLLRNEGGFRFVDVTNAAGVGHNGWGTSTGFLDYDRDDDLDLFVVNYINWSEATDRDCFNPMGGSDYCPPLTFNAPTHDTLYRNEGDGRFVDVSAEAGIRSGRGNGLGVTFGDFDGDGWIDIFVANDGNGDRLWSNQRDGTFKDVALVAGCAVDLEGGVPKAGMGVTAGDVDGDLDLDLIVCNLVDESDSVFRNDGSYFTDITTRSGLAVASRRFTRFGMGWVDLDNDGWLDLYQGSGRVVRASKLFADDPFAEPNLLFQGDPSGRFRQVPYGGTESDLYGASRAVVFGDVDDDGRIDLLVVNRDGAANLLLNVTPPRNWVRFRLLTRTGRDALGAWLTIEHAGGTLRRDVQPGYSYLASNDPRVHVGLGEVEKVDQLRVHWADGSTERFGPFATGATHELRQGEGRSDG